MSNFAFALAAFMSMAGQGQEAPSKVSYETVAVPVKVAIDAIAKQTGAKLDVAKEAQEEIVILSVKNAPLSDVLAKIADVTSCEWGAPDQDGTSWLKHSLSQMRKEKREEVALRAKQLSAAIADLAKKIAPKKDDKATKKPEDILGFQPTMPWAASITSPTGKAIAKLAQLMDPNALAKIGDGERVVFSTNPTPVQVPLTGRATQILNDLVAEQKAFADKMRADMKADDPQIKAAEQMTKMMGIKLMPDTIDAPPAKALLIAYKGSAFGMTRERTCSLA